MNPALGKVFEVAQEILDCACVALDATDAQCPNRTCIVPGIEPSFEHCCEGGGQLTLNVVRWFESSTFPSISIAGGGPVGPTSAANNCALPYTVVEYLLTVVRCTPVGNGQRPPSCESQTGSARTLISDAEAVRAGVKCCVENFPKMQPWAVGDTMSVGPEGGCAGSTLVLWVGLSNCRPC